MPYMRIFPGPPLVSAGVSTPSMASNVPRRRGNISDDKLWVSPIEARSPISAPIPSTTPVKPPPPTPTPTSTPATTDINQADTPDDTFIKSILWAESGPIASGKTDRQAAAILNTANNRVKLKRDKNPDLQLTDIMNNMDVYQAIGGSEFNKYNEFHQGTKPPTDADLKKMLVIDKIYDDFKQGKLADPSGGGTHFWDDSIATPYWAVGLPQKKIGNMIFVTTPKFSTYAKRKHKY